MKIRLFVWFGVPFFVCPLNPTESNLLSTIPACFQQVMSLDRSGVVV
jgi:hypothetical protein